MATSQKLSRDFHRLGLVLAAIPLVLGLGWTALTPVIYSNMFPHALTGIATTFAATLAVYGIVRAIGWVIGAVEVARGEPAQSKSSIRNRVVLDAT